MEVWLAVTALLAAGPAAPVWPAAPRLPVLPGKRPAVVARPAAGFIHLSISPAIVTFDATNPDWMPMASGDAGASLSWQNPIGSQGAWSLTVQADSAVFANCRTVPISAVTVSCVSAVTNTSRSGNCRQPFHLSASPQIVAGGRQGMTTFSYDVALTFTLADNWKYIAQTSPPCSLSLSYTATVP